MKAQLALMFILMTSTGCENISKCLIQDTRISTVVSDPKQAKEWIVAKGQFLEQLTKRDHSQPLNQTEIAELQDAADILRRTHQCLK